jgi:hypothetical protein
VSDTAISAQEATLAIARILSSVGLSAIPGQNAAQALLTRRA